MKQTILSSIIAVLLTVTIQPCIAGEVTGLLNFTSGTPARAGEVNGNFQATKTAVDDNHQRIAALEATNATLLSRIAALEAKLASVSVITHNGQPTVRFEGVNVQVVNGMNTTGTANGTGNLIVGYDEPDTSATYRCTLGTNPSTGTIINDETTCTAAGATWTNEGFKTGSHYIIAGAQHNYSRWGGMLSGLRNTSNYNFASVNGGWNNTSSGLYSSVSGGGYNTASGGAANVAGGARNIADGGSSVISGGFGNTSTGNYSSISGGQSNRTNNAYSSILGGVSQNTSTNSQTIPAIP